MEPLFYSKASDVTEPSATVISSAAQGSLKTLLGTMTISLSLFLGTVVLHAEPSIAATSSTEPLPTPNKGFQTKSGLKYFDFGEGLGKSPRYGQLVSFHYTGYYRATPDSSLEAFDTQFSTNKDESFLHKHGNGRLVRGLDEGLHTMKVGGKRRMIVPKEIGYTELGLGPVPSDPSQRRRLGGLLDELLQGRGELIFDVELVMVADDENDQGYYEDEPVTQEEVRKLVLKSLNTNGTIILTLRALTPTPLCTLLLTDLNFLHAPSTF